MLGTINWCDFNARLTLHGVARWRGGRTPLWPLVLARARHGVSFLHKHARHLALEFADDILSSPMGFKLVLKGILPLPPPFLSLSPLPPLLPLPPLPPCRRCCPRYPSLPRLLPPQRAVSRPPPTSSSSSNGPRHLFFLIDHLLRGAETP